MRLLVGIVCIAHRILLAFTFILLLGILGPGSAWRHDH